jgi:integrase/recombinase XerC
MARKASPWWWQEEQGWYVNHQGKRHFLGKQPANATRPQKSPKTGRWNAPQEIEKAFRALLDNAVASPLPVPGDLVIQVLDDFIGWCKENRAKLTASRYAEFCQDFVNTEDDGQKLGQLDTLSVTSKHVTTWLNQHAKWGPTTKKNAITAIQAALNWAVKNRGLERNPIKGMLKPEAKRRGNIITPEEFETILQSITDAFADLLIVSYDCGARPFEVKELEARHFQADKQRAVIPADEAKGRKHTRVFYFPTDRSMGILQRLCKERPLGTLFLNNRGNKWTGDAVKCAFARLEETLGKRVCHYDFRRTFITRKIIAGVDSHVVARLSGHQSTAMIDKHYSAVANDHEFMLKMASQDIKVKEVNPSSNSSE